MEKTDEVFSASWDAGTWAMTTLGVVLMLIVAVCIFVSTTDIVGRSIAAGDIVLLVAIGCFAPYRYVVTDTDIIIKRLAASPRISIQDVSEVKRAEGGLLNENRRVAGCGGLFGYFGRFRSKPLGTYSAQVTRWEDLVLIRRKSTVPVLLSPDRPDEFIEAVRNRFQAQGNVLSG